MLYKVGVTGNICSGKSACVKFLSKQPHCHGINFDELGHSIYHRNFIFLNQIKQIFTNNIFNNRNTFFENLNRKELGKIVFAEGNSGDKNLEILNSLIRPEMRNLLKLKIQIIERQLLEENKKGILFVEGALIVEANSINLFDEVWMTKASREEIEKRFKNRLEENKIIEYDQNILNRILNKQMNEEEKEKYCSEIIDTSDEIEITKIKYLNLYNKLVIKLKI